MSPAYGYVVKLILESEFQHKGNKQTNSQQNLTFFYWQEQILKTKILRILHRKGFKNIWTKFSSLGQEPTFYIQIIKIHALTRVK